MTDTLYQKYLNIQKFIIEYRKYDILDKFLDKDAFAKAILREHYVKCRCRDPRKQKNIDILLLKADNKYMKSTINFKKLISNLEKESQNIIIISKDPFSVYIKKLLQKLPNTINITNYQHKHFSVEIPKGPLCSKHTILTQSEVQQICSNELMIHPLGLPSILVSDPQCIWIGAEIGQVIRIESLSEITGKAIRYRMVVPSVDTTEQAEETTETVAPVDAEDIDI